MGGRGAPSLSRMGTYTYPSPNQSADVIHCEQKSIHDQRESINGAVPMTRPSIRSACGSVTQSGVANVSVPAGCQGNAANVSLMRDVQRDTPDACPLCPWRGAGYQVARGRCAVLSLPLTTTTVVPPPTRPAPSTHPGHRWRAGPT
jgi:hypothetical protein